ncbi:hypothetical protein EJ03DRAFT_378510, partial [Teratosphaeria nubilosa]
MLSQVLLGLALSSLGAAQVPIVTQYPVTTQTSFANPSCTGSAASTESFTFESVERADSITGLIPIGEYNLLAFRNIQWVDTDPDLDGNHLGLAPHTYPDAATFGAGVDSLTASTPVISAEYIESTVESFTPRSWWYGCVLPSPYTAGSLPVGCNSKFF